MNNFDVLLVMVLLILCPHMFATYSLYIQLLYSCATRDSIVM